MWTQQHFADLYRNGYLILRGLVPVELVGPAKAALENGKDGSAPEILSLLRDSPLHQFLCEGLRGGGYNKVDGAQAGANGPREPGTRNMQTGWPEVDVPFYGWCGHVDGIWSGGASAPQGRGDPTFDPKKFYSEPAVNGHMLEYGEHEGCRANLQLTATAAAQRSARWRDFEAVDYSAQVQCGEYALISLDPSGDALSMSLANLYYRFTYLCM